MTDAQREEFYRLSKPLIRWLNDNCNPHTIVIVSPDGAEVMVGEIGLKTEEFIKD